MTDPLLGLELSRYRLVRKLGQGGTGAVYVGLQEAIGAQVAIKVLTPQLAHDPDLIERFFAEARTVNQIRHEAIAGVLDLARLPDGRPYIIMELVDGQTLGHICRHARVPLGGLVDLVVEVLGALSAAHALGIVHRDLKPDNIMVTPRGHAKVLDFGIAKLAESGQLARTQTGALLGTPAYMAPEQIADARSVDPRADLYAIGILLFEAVAGRLPFTGSTFELMRAHAEDPPPSIRMLRPEVPAALEQVIETALAKDPARRFANAAAMASALQAAAADLPVGERIPVTPIVRDVPPSAGAPFVTPSMIVPSAVAPSAVAPSVVAPSAVAPSMVAPSAVAPSMAAPSAVAPSMVAPSVGPSMGAPPTNRRRRVVAIAVTSTLVLGGVVAIGIVRSGDRSPPNAVDAGVPGDAAPDTVRVVVADADRGFVDAGEIHLSPRRLPAFDPRTFDPIAYLAIATREAKAYIQRDVFLSSIEIRPVRTRVEFSRPHLVRYRFGAGQGVCVNATAEPEGGSLEVDVSCKATPVRPPKCSFAQLLARNELAGYLANAPVDLRYQATPGGAEWAIHARMFGDDETNEADDDLCR